ncbi:hypothetical protein AB2N04_03570 [Nitratireductor sp. GISD-1A_MAKvit]|uniref:hypothetical protein n=1 Tax=Nitratireductor sp. GISD-1A_MAKvit TaxID=3234198 RepID=UPI00346612B7
MKAAPPGDPYIKVSDALPLPEFIPGLGTLFIDPETLPAGPFLAYDELSVGSHTISGVDIYYNAGHELIGR